MKQEDKNITALINILSDSQSRIIALYYDNKNTANKIEKLLKKQLSDKYINILNLNKLPANNLLNALHQEIERNSENILLIYGLENKGFRFSNTEQKQVPTDFLIQLNIDRERFFYLNHGKIIFMINRSYRSLLKMELADFWDWIFYQFNFSASTFSGAPQWKIQHNSNKAGSLAQSFIATREKIQKLEKQIQNLNKKNPPPQQLIDKLSHLINLYIKTGQLSAATGYIDRALEVMITNRKITQAKNLLEKIVKYFYEKNKWTLAEKYQKKLLEILEKYPSTNKNTIEKAQNTLKDIINQKENN